MSNQTNMTKDLAIDILRNHGLSRIVNKIELLWGYPELDEYLTKLIISDREDRAGFDLQVFDALLHLSNLHTSELLCNPAQQNNKHGWRTL